MTTWTRRTQITVSPSDWVSRLKPDQLFTEVPERLFTEDNFIILI